MYTVLILILIGFLLFKRKRIHWPGLLVGVALTVLLLGTPVGGPLVDMVHSFADAVTDVGSSVLHIAAGSGAA